MGFLSPHQLNCDNQPFFEGFHPLLTSAKAFYNSVLSLEGDIFEGREVTWVPFRKTLLVRFLEPASKLGGSPFFKSCRGAFGSGRSCGGSREDEHQGRLYNLIGRILKANVYQKLAYNVNLIRGRKKDLHR